MVAMQDLDLIKERIHQSIYTKEMLLSDEQMLVRIHELSEEIISTIRSGGKILICGNGGSASDALHFAGEIVGRFQRERKGWPAIALNADVAALTAIANDYGYHSVFERMSEAYMTGSDLLIGISTSGNSENVYRALKKAQEIGGKTAALLGGSGGRIAPEVDLSIIVPSKITARVQECHIAIIHIICELIEDRLS
ncbi:SIS domain-containing protein [uncultured Oscillibacter sp.]|uniref:SIS domain-containing protein n=1 Tax=uncultured Oscillibacter sp. TaxID=876091 RepID=UPI0025EA00E4|nr:SIS domain-containing protein [uncultured Oscillibacter sp.]